MNKPLLLSALLAPAFTGATAQDIGNFQRERERMINDYNSFRNDILSRYAQFLGEAWNDYKAFRGEKQFPDKKPSTPVKAPEKSADEKPEDITPRVIVPKDTEPDKDPRGENTPITVDPFSEKVDFQFYGIGMKATKVNVPRLASVSEKDISQCWAKMQEDRIYEKVVPSLKLLVRGGELSDWLTFVLVRKYADSLCQGDANTSIVLSHYLLVNMGYDIRLGRSGNEMLLLVATRQMVYLRRFLEIDGRKYFIFFKETEFKEREIGGVSTCAIPSGTDLGKPINLVTSAPQLRSGKSISFDANAGGISVKGTIDEVVKRIAADFPQADIPVYAASSLSVSFRKNLLEQVGEQVKGMSQADAANAILRFVQLAFKYKTDNEQFGTEKYFFAEENFIYPANDCEDRAILFAYLIRNILHLDVHLIQYPNHESTAVAFTEKGIDGDGYSYKGKRYIICDPTYMMASIGQCMPQFKDVKPKVQIW